MTVYCHPHQAGRGPSSARLLRPVFSAKRLFAVMLPLAAILFLMAGNAWSRGAPDSFADLAEKLSPAVVNISTLQRVKVSGREALPRFPQGSPFEEFFHDFFERQQRNGRTRRMTSLGSGFIIDPSGIVITNNHVIADADEVTVRLSNGDELKATILARDTRTDVAILKVEADEDLPFVEFGDSDALRVGDWVLTIGNPFGLGGTVTAGIVSARNRNINAGPYDDFIQTDASINRGNSGGPMFNMDGLVVGINTAIFSPSGGSVGIGFAIPSALAAPVISQLREFGETRRGWLGVQIQTVTDEIAESLGMDEAKGAMISIISEDGPAEAAGLRQSDVIIKFDGKDIPEMRTLPRVVAETHVGKEVDVEVWRDGRIRKFKVELGRLETSGVDGTGEDGQKDEEGFGEEEVLGMTLTGLNTLYRERFEVPEETSGVLVIDVDPDSSAAKKGIRRGDIIVEVGQEEVDSPHDIADRIAMLREKGKKKSVLLLVERGGNKTFIAVRLKKS